MFENKKLFIRMIVGVFLLFFVGSLVHRVWEVFYYNDDLINALGKSPHSFEQLIRWLRHRDIWTLILVPMSAGATMLWVERKTQFEPLRYVAVIFFTLAQAVAVMCWSNRHYSMAVRVQAVVLAWIMLVLSWHPKAKGALLLSIIAHVGWMVTILLKILSTNPEIIQLINGELRLEYVIDGISQRDIRDTVKLALGTMLFVLVLEARTQVMFLRYLAVGFYTVAQTIAILCTFYWNGGMLCAVIATVAVISFIMFCKGVRGALPMCFSAFFGFVMLMCLVCINGIYAG